MLLELAIMAKDAAVSAMHGRWGGDAEQTVKRRMNIEGIKKVNEWLRAFGRFGPCKKIERKYAL